jgi:hypothetical protein
VCHIFGDSYYIKATLCLSVCLSVPPIPTLISTYEKKPKAKNWLTEFQEKEQIEITSTITSTNSVENLPKPHRPNQARSEATAAISPLMKP